MPLVVLSPHLDDGVLSCGALLSSHPGSVVATTHAGRPRDDLPGQWDITCGFGTASEAMDARLAEDKRALAVLGATAAYCPALDSQYPSSATIRRLAQRNFIERVLDSYEAERLLLPLGLLHGDHIETRNAALAVLRSHGGRGRHGASTPTCLTAPGFRSQSKVRNPRWGSSDTTWVRPEEIRSRILTRSWKLSIATNRKWISCLVYPGSMSSRYSKKRAGR